MVSRGLIQSNNNFKGNNPMLGQLSKIERENSVLILGGTGVNFWQYFPALRHLSLKKLSEFNAIYTISGGSGCLFFYMNYVLGKLRYEKLASADKMLRTHLNQDGIIKRMDRVFRNEYVYDVNDLLKFVGSFVSLDAMNFTFKNLPLQNVNVVAQNCTQNKFQIFNKENSPDQNFAVCISNAGFPRTMGKKKLCKGILIDGEDITDFDFAPRESRKKFKEFLQQEHGGKSIYYLNVLESKQSGVINYVNVSKAAYPQGRQLLDFVLAFCNLPNKSPLRYLS